MDELIKQTETTIQEFKSRLTRHEQSLIDELDRVRGILDAIEERPSKAATTVRYDVIDDIVPLVKSAAKPILQSEIFQSLKRTVMDKLNYSEKEAQSNIYRSLWYHTKHGPGASDDRGIRAVEAKGSGYRVVQFRTKGTKSTYPDNLIWHKDRLA